MLLQNIVFPKIGICTDEGLYYRGNGRDCYYDYENEKLMISVGEVVQFNTYFNSVLGDRWKKYTVIKDLGIMLAGEGRGILNVYRESSFNGRELIFSKEISLSAERNRHLLLTEEEQIYGILYFEFHALANSSISGGAFYTNTEGEQDVSLGVVITTFKRESYVRRNMASLEHHLFNKIGDKNLHFFIIDNGQTLEAFPSERITVVPNKNYGGAGGYGKGLLLNYCLGKYNHVVFCDDDATYEPEAFLRLFYFLSLAKDSNLCVGGSMLLLDAPVIMHESGAVFFCLDAYSLHNHMLNMVDFGSLHRFNIEEKALYHGWWFFCCPTIMAEKIGLPIPVFFQIDDIEYSLRLRENNYKTADLNGICVWHESFARKSSTAVNYYWLRNSVIKSMLHESEVGRWYLLKKFNWHFCLALFMYRYDRARMMLRGLEDALKGPEFLMQLDPAGYHQMLMQAQEDKPHAIEASQIILSKYDRPVRNDRIKRLAMMLTLNGILLPACLRHKEMVMEPLWSFRTTATFRQESVLYVDIDRMSGFVVHRNVKRFWSLFFKMLWMDWKIFTKFSSCREKYRESFPIMTSIAFWKKYVGDK